MSEFTMLTLSGKTFDLGNPRIEDVVMSDVVRSLHRIYRFIGHTGDPYSVLVHSILVALECYARALVMRRALARTTARLGLFHDAGEAYTGDITSPMKRLLGLQRSPAIVRIERCVERALLPDIDPTLADVLHREFVKPADNVLLRWEQEHLRPVRGELIEDPGAPLIDPAAIMRDMPACHRFAFYSLHEALLNGARLPLWTHATGTEVTNA